VLRKDFTVSERDVVDARIMGADAVLLIVAALADDELARLHAVSEALGMSTLVEVHDESELKRALSIGATLVGVNQRDLHSFAVDTTRAVRVARLIPAGVLAVAESGIAGADDARRCADAGYRAVLVGEHLVRAANPEKAVSELRVPLPS
jgi:indole-3-glycerol phosphate synthase